MKLTRNRGEDSSMSIAKDEWITTTELLSDTYLRLLDKVIAHLPQFLNKPDEWDSLVINRRKPYTYRVFRNFGDFRVCLHKFEPCSQFEAFSHPHPWPAAFLILKGKYVQTLGYSLDLASPPVINYQEILCPYSKYCIIDNKLWHKIQPLETTYTIMVNGQPFEEQHKEVKTTKGKDLQKMSLDEVRTHLYQFDLLTSEMKFLESPNI